MSEQNPNAAAEERGTSDIFGQRVAKVAELREQGIDPFGCRYDDVQSIESVRTLPAETEDAPGAVVNVAGRLTGKRGMGKSIFADLRDSTGKIQLFAGKSDLGDEPFALFKKLDIGDIAGVKGELFKTRMGELTIRVKEFKLLSKSLFS